MTKGKASKSWREKLEKKIENAEPLSEGNAIGTKIASGIARILESTKDADKLKEGEIVVT